MIVDACITVSIFICTTPPPESTAYFIPFTSTPIPFAQISPINLFILKMNYVCSFIVLFWVYYIPQVRIFSRYSTQFHFYSRLESYNYLHYSVCIQLDYEQPRIWTTSSFNSANFVGFIMSSLSIFNHQLPFDMGNWWLYIQYRSLF